MDDSTMDSLVERFYQSLYHFALSLARSEVVAADLTQETYYLWAAKGHQLRDATKVKSWLSMVESSILIQRPETGVYSR